MQDLRKLEKYLPDNEEVKDFYSEIFNLPTCEGDSNETIQPDDWLLQIFYSLSVVYAHVFE